MPKKPIVPKQLKSSKKSKNEDDLSEPDIDETEKPEDDIIDNDTDKEEDEESEDETEYNPNYDEDGKTCGIKTALEDDEDYVYDDEDVEALPDTTVEYVKNEDRQSSARLTKYEMVRILGERTEQLTMGAKPLIKNHKGLPYDKIAEEELKTNMIPFKIRRPLPNGKYELWTLDELQKGHLLSLLE